MRKLGLCLAVFMFSMAVAMGGKPVKVVVLDAGHGGNDPGAIGISGVNEKDINLKLVLMVGKMLETNYPDIKVVYTRKTDVFIPLNRRAQIANEQHADFFMSIHCNSAPNATSYGTETFVMGMDKSAANLAVAQKENASILLESNTKENYGDFDPTSPEAYIIFSLYQNVYLDQSLTVASAIQAQFKNVLHRNDRGVKQAPLLVLWRTAMPSILVEAGFLSNKDEEAYLNSSKGQEELAQSMYRGIEKMIKANAPEVVAPVAEKKTAETTETPATAKEDKPVAVKPAATPAKPATPAKTNGVPENTPYKLVIDSSKAVNYKIQYMTMTTVVDKRITDKIPDTEIVQLGAHTYKYYSGKLYTYKEAYERLEYVSTHGYADAFMVAYDAKGNRLSIADAKKIENQ